MIPSPPSLLKKETNSLNSNGWSYSEHELDDHFDSFLKALISIVNKEDTPKLFKKIPLKHQIVSKNILKEGETIDISSYSPSLGTSYYDQLTLNHPSSQDMVNQIDEHYKMLRTCSSNIRKNENPEHHKIYERMRHKYLVNIVGSLLNFNQVYKKNEYDDLCKFHTVMHFGVDQLNSVAQLGIQFSFEIMGIDVPVHKHCIPVLEDDHFSFYILNTRDMTIQVHSRVSKEGSFVDKIIRGIVSQRLKTVNENPDPSKYKPHCFHLEHVNEETIQFMKVLNMSKVPLKIVHSTENDLKTRRDTLNHNEISATFIELHQVVDTDIVFHSSSSSPFSNTYKMYEPRLETNISILTYNLGRSASSYSDKKLMIKGCFSDDMVDLGSGPSNSIPATMKVDKKECFKNIIRIAKERSTDIVCLQEIREEDLIQEVSSSFSPFHISESHVLADRRNGLMTLYRQHLYYLDQSKGGGVFKGEMVSTVPSVSNIDTFPYLILYLREKKDDRRSICIINIQFPTLKIDNTIQRKVVKHMIETKLNEIVPYHADIVFLSGDFGYSFTMKRGESMSFKSKDEKETILKYGSYHQDGSNPSTCCTNTGNIEELKYKNDTIFANVDSALLRLDFYPRDSSVPNFAFSSTHLPVRAYIK